MKDLILNIGKKLWTEHRKKLIALVMGLAFAGLASVSGIPLEEIKQAALDAASTPTAATPAPTPAPSLLAPQAPTILPEVK